MENVFEVQKSLRTKKQGIFSGEMSENLPNE